MLSKRSLEKEIIDLGSAHYTKAEYEDCLVKLDRIGRWLGGDSATLSALKKMNPHPLSILDVGCGGGLFTIRIAQKFPQAQVVGIDLNEQAIEFAKRSLVSMKNPPDNVRFELRTQPKLAEASNSYDVVLSTLVCHHIPDQDLVEFLSAACQVAKRKVIINDLHRHVLAFGLFKLISPVFFRNRLVQHDGPLSVCRAFKYQDLKQYLSALKREPSHYKISWKWAFRWLLEIDCQRESL